MCRCGLPRSAGTLSGAGAGGGGAGLADGVEADRGVAGAAVGRRRVAAGDVGQRVRLAERLDGRAHVGLAGRRRLHVDDRRAVGQRRDHALRARHPRVQPHRPLPRPVGVRTRTRAGRHVLRPQARSAPAARNGLGCATGRQVCLKARLPGCRTQQASLPSLSLNHAAYGGGGGGGGGGRVLRRKCYKESSSRS